MSLKATKAALELSAGSTVSAGAKFILMVLADFADSDGKCYPAISTIAEKGGLSARQVSRHIATLAAADMIEVKTGKGRNNVSVYQIKHDTFDTKHDTCVMLSEPENMTLKAENMTLKALKHDRSVIQTSYNHIEPNNIIMLHFHELTFFPIPHETTLAYREKWLEPSQAILAAGQKFGLSEQAIKDAVTEAVNIHRGGGENGKRYHLGNVGSILKTTLNLLGQTQASANGTGNEPIVLNDDGSY